MNSTLRLLGLLLCGSAVSCTHSDQTGMHSKDRVSEWGEHYFDLTRNVNPLETTLDVAGLERLFSATFAIETDFNVVGRPTVQCAPVQFGNHLYYVTRPIPFGSFNNAIFGYRFHIRKPDDVGGHTDTRIGMMFDQHRRLISVTVQGGVFGSTKQFWVDPDTIEPSLQLASATRAAMRKAMDGDNHEEDYWNSMPNFVEKFIVAVDNNIRRK